MVEIDRKIESPYISIRNVALELDRELSKFRVWKQDT